MRVQFGSWGGELGNLLDAEGFDALLALGVQGGSGRGVGAVGMVHVACPVAPGSG